MYSTSALQKQAIEAAKSAYARLPHGDKIFQQCVQGRETLAECLNTVEHKYHIHKKKRSTRFMAKLEKYTAWLRNISSVIDVAIQTQAGIGCPLWAPIKFVLKVRYRRVLLHAKRFDSCALGFQRSVKRCGAGRRFIGLDHRMPSTTRDL